MEIKADIETDDWNRDSHQMTKDAYGVFEIVLPAVNGQPAIAHDSKIKVRSLSIYFSHKPSLLVAH